MDQNITKMLKMGHSKLCPILLIKKNRNTSYFLWLLILLSFAIICYPPQGICDLAADYNRQGMERMDNGRYREAIVYFEAAHGSAPEDENIKKNLSVAYHSLAAEYASEKDWYQAIQNERLALKNDPGNEIIKKQLSTYYNNHGLEYAEKERYDLAKDHIRGALKYTPDSDIIETNLYNIILKEADSCYKNNNDYKALNLAREAISLMPDNATAYIFLGNIYYQQDNFKDALISWNKALKINPENKTLQTRIEKLKREKRIEEAFRTKKREHFKIRFEREADSGYIWAISDILEDARRKLRHEFNLYPDEVIPVIVYTGEQFQEATATAHWTLGLYDGKIRLKKHDITRSKDILRRTLSHEYTHAVIYLVYGSNIPVWLHEGFAQFNEPERLLGTADKRFLRSYIKKHGDFSTENIDSMFTRKDDIDAVRAAYLESKIFVKYLVERYRKHKIKRLFEELKEGRGWQEALKEVYGKSIDRLDKEFREYLQNILMS